MFTSQVAGIHFATPSFSKKFTFSSSFCIISCNFLSYPGTCFIVSSRLIFGNFLKISFTYSYFSFIFSFTSKDFFFFFAVFYKGYFKHLSHSCPFSPHLVHISRGYSVPKCPIIPHLLHVLFCHFVSIALPID